MRKKLFVIPPILFIIIFIGSYLSFHNLKEYDVKTSFLFGIVFMVITGLIIFFGERMKDGIDRELSKDDINK